jgi:hypothetical protein
MGGSLDLPPGESCRCLPAPPKLHKLLRGRRLSHYGRYTVFPGIQTLNLGTLLVPVLVDQQQDVPQTITVSIGMVQLLNCVAEPND